MTDHFDVTRWRPAPFLPERESRNLSLTFVVAVLCFLACLTAMGVIAANRASAGWTVTNSVTQTTATAFTPGSDKIVCERPYFDQGAVVRALGLG